MNHKTRDYSQYLKKLLCFLFGHCYFIVTRIDNSRSIFGHYKCQRCGKEEMYQYDYL